ncbi:MAG: branched-chain amino acid ABC transporter permease [Actinomycetota bacterium]|nr:branched-chain amino acid ABC transporter permease [Actinomycetota bacterium]
MPFKVHHNSVQHWAIRAVWAVATILFLLYIPTKGETGTVGDMTFALQLAIAAMALNLVMGFGGIVSIGHSAYFGLGGYTTAILVDHYGWSQGWTFYVAAVLGFVVGCATSLPALRLKGVYLALVTLGLAVLFPQLIKWKKATWLTDGARGIDDIGYDDVPRWPILGELRREEGRVVFMWWVTVIVVVLAYLVCRGIVKSRVGRSLIAIRDNETAAAVMGVNTARTKTIVFGVSAAMCAVAGSLFAVSGKIVNPDLRNFTLVGSIIFLLVMVLGGAATLWGPIVGAIAYVVVETRTREAAANGEGVIGWLFGWMSGSPAALILALAMLAIMFLAPFGIIGLLKRLAAKVVVLIPRPAGSGTNVPPVDDAEAPSIDEPFLPITTGETP